MADNAQTLRDKIEELQKELGRSRETVAILQREIVRITGDHETLNSQYRNHLKEFHGIDIGLTSNAGSSLNLGDPSQRQNATQGNNAPTLPLPTSKSSPDINDSLSPSTSSQQAKRTIAQRDADDENPEDDIVYMGTTIYTTQTPDKQSVHVKKAKLTRNEPHMSNKSTPEVVLPYFNRRPTTPRQQPAPVTKRSVILKLPTYVPENIRHEHTKDMERKPNDTTPSMLLATPNDELKLHHNPVPDSDETWLSPLPSTSNAWNPMDSESELSSPPQSPAPSDKDRFELKPAVKKMTPAKSANHKKQPKFSNSGLLADSIRKRLDEYTHNNPVDFEKHKGIINRGLPRKKGLSELFGGSFMGFFHNISNTKRTEHNHQYKRFLCPKIENNCEAPLSVGTPGIIFRIDCDRDDEMLACTVDKIITGVKENEWVYCGDYKKYRSTPLTSEEWSYLNKELRDGWIKLIHEAKEGIKCRARHTVILRHKLKWAPTKQELDEFVEKVKSDEQLGKLSKEEVAKAFEAGHLRIAVWVLQCVKYDVEFATRIAEWVKAANGTSNPDPTPAKQSPSPPSKRKAPVKAKRSVTPDDEKQWENDSYEDSEIEDFEAVRPYHSTGTKSRPAN